jgi:hypothetical protein
VYAVFTYGQAIAIFGLKCDVRRYGVTYFRGKSAPDEGSALRLCMKNFASIAADCGHAAWGNLIQHR